MTTTTFRATADRPRPPEGAATMNILDRSGTYWATGITLAWQSNAGGGQSGWRGNVEYFDDGFVSDNPDKGAISTEGVLRTRYAVRDGEAVTGLRAVVDTLMADAMRLGITFTTHVAEDPPNLYYEGDGEGDDTLPDGWRGLLQVEADRIGWRSPYSDRADTPTT